MVYICRSLNVKQPVIVIFGINIFLFFIAERKIVFVLFFCAGSGSTYLYGYCDANFRLNMTKEECLEFVQKGRYL